MKKYKEDIKTILEVLTYFGVYFALSLHGNPILSNIILLCLIGYFFYRVFRHFQYKKGEASYILFPTENDKDIKESKIILGFIMLIINILLIVIMDFYYWFVFILIGIGVILIINGIIGLPGGYLNIKNNMLHITGLKRAVDIRQIETISITKTTIVLSNAFNEKTTCRYFLIDEHYAGLIEKHLESKRTSQMKFKIENNMS